MTRNWPSRFLFVSLLFLTHYSLLTTHSVEAAISKGKEKQLAAGGPNQGGGTPSSSSFRQLAVVGGPLASHQIITSRFHIIPGFLGAASGSSVVPPVSDLDLPRLYAKTDPMGEQVAPKTWQTDNDPIFLWEAPATGLELAGYSYALDAAPDDVVDTTGTSFNVQTATPKTLTDGTHTFSVKAITTSGTAGTAAMLELWVDTTPPQIVSYAPSAGALLNGSAVVTATVSDVASGFDDSSVSLLMNGTTASAAFDPATGVLTAGAGGWKEGVNSLELRASDALGNAQVPLVWSVTVDTKPPTGSITVNADALMTTSIYANLGLSAPDATSGVDHILLSNDELTGYVEEPFTALRTLWKLKPIRGIQKVYVKFVDKVGNVSSPVWDEIELALLSPDTVITNGPAGYTPNPTVTFGFACPEGGCVYSYAFDNDEWSEWSATSTATKDGLAFGNHYFRVKAALDINGLPGIQSDEEDPSPAERTWIVGIEPSLFMVPRGPHIKLWRLE